MRRLFALLAGLCVAGCTALTGVDVSGDARCLVNPTAVGAPPGGSTIAYLVVRCADVPAGVHRDTLAATERNATLHRIVSSHSPTLRGDVMADAGLTVRKRDIRNAFTVTPPAIPVISRAAEWPVPVKTASALLRIRQRGAVLADEIEGFRVGLCVARAAKDETGAPQMIDGRYVLTADDTVAIQAEFAALLDEEVTLAGCRAITLAELGDAPRITAGDLELLGPFVVEG